MSTKSVWRRAAEMMGKPGIDGACLAIQKAATGSTEGWHWNNCDDLRAFKWFFEPQRHNSFYWWDEDAEGETARIIALLSMEHIE